MSKKELELKAECTVSPEYTCSYDNDLGRRIFVIENGSTVAIFLIQPITRRLKTQFVHVPAEQFLAVKTEAVKYRDQLIKNNLL